MTETKRYISKLTAGDPAPVTIPRGVLRNLLDNFELLSIGSEQMIFRALIDHVGALVEGEARMQRSEDNNVVQLFPVTNR